MLRSSTSETLSLFLIRGWLGAATGIISTCSSGAPRKPGDTFEPITKSAVFSMSASVVPERLVSRTRIRVCGNCWENSSNAQTRDPTSTNTSTAMATSDSKRRASEFATASPELPDSTVVLHGDTEPDPHRSLQPCDLPR